MRERMGEDLMLLSPSSTDDVYLTLLETVMF